MRRAATWISQARGSSGTPSRGHCAAAAISASWTASSAAREVAEAPHDRAEHLRRELAQQVLGAGSGDGERHSSSMGGALITCRTSIAMLSGAPPGPGAAEASAAIS